jgi:hypothetical protein
MGTKDYKRDIKRYMDIIAKGQAKGNTTGACNDQIEIVNSSPNELILPLKYHVPKFCLIMDNTWMGNMVC